MIIARMRLAVCGMGFEYSGIRDVNTRTSVGRNMICTLWHSIGTCYAFELNGEILCEKQQIALFL